MLGHASNLGRGDTGKFAAKIMVDFSRSVNLENDHQVLKKIKINAGVRNVMLSSTAVKESELVE